MASSSLYLISCSLSVLHPCNVSFQSPSQLNSRYQKVTGKPLKETDGGFAYDAVWAIVLALNRTEKILKETKSPLSIDNFTYANTDIMEYFNRSLEETNFTGVTVSQSHYILIVYEPVTSVRLELKHRRY